MKKVIGLLVVTLVMGLTAIAQDSQGSMSGDKMSQGDSSAKPQLMDLKGTVKNDGDKYMFVNDKDQKSWDVMNPEALKGHEGHHVKLSAHVYADKNQIHVMSVKMMKGDSMKKDSMSK